MINNVANLTNAHISKNHNEIRSEKKTRLLKNYKLIKFSNVIFLKGKLHRKQRFFSLFEYKVFSFFEWLLSLI